MNSLIKSLAACCLVAMLGFVGCGNRQSESDVPDEPGSMAVSIPEEIRPGLWIVDPQDNAPVPYRPYVVGTLSDTAVTDLAVIVHAIGGEGYWVQPRVAIRPDGVWICQPHIGMPDSPSGSRFEVRAFGKFNSPTTPGAELPGWPRAALASNLVTLVRE